MYAFFMFFDISILIWFYKGGIMYKVKIFDEEHELDLEEAINYFLESEDINKLIDIKYSVDCILSNCGEQIYCYSALIIYM